MDTLTLHSRRRARRKWRITPAARRMRKTSAELMFSHGLIRTTTRLQCASVSACRCICEQERWAPRSVTPTRRGSLCTGSAGGRETLSCRCSVLHNADMGFVRDLLLVLNRHGRALEGSAAFPRPPELPVPPDLKHAIDGLEPEDEGPDPSL